MFRRERRWLSFLRTPTFMEDIPRNGKNVRILVLNHFVFAVTNYATFFNFGHDSIERFISTFFRCVTVIPLEILNKSDVCLHISLIPRGCAIIKPSKKVSESLLIAVAVHHCLLSPDRQRGIIVADAHFLGTHTRRVPYLKDSRSPRTAWNSSNLPHPFNVSSSSHTEAKASHLKIPSELHGKKPTCVRIFDSQAIAVARGRTHQTRSTQKEHVYTVGSMQKKKTLNTSPPPRRSLMRCLATFLGFTPPLQQFL
jgi:hypothetical protein